MPNKIIINTLSDALARILVDPNPKSSKSGLIGLEIIFRLPTVMLDKYLVNGLSKFA